MANWVADFLIINSDLSVHPIVKRARHSIHFERNNGERVAIFTGAPCHFQDDDGLWKPLDTKLLPLSGGFYGAPGLDVLINLDGRVRLLKDNYEQLVDLPGSPFGYLDGDRIVREFPGGRQFLVLTEAGFHEEIILEKKTFPIEKFIVKKQGNLPVRFIEGQMVAFDKKGDRFVFTGDLAAFAAWMEKASYPVMIDPDFAGSTNDGQINGGETTSYTTTRNTCAGEYYSNAEYSMIGQMKDGSYYYIWRSFLKFDTSAIPDDNTVNQVNLKLVSVGDFSTSDFDLYISKCNWSGQDPLGPPTSTLDIAYDSCLSSVLDDNIWRNTSGMSQNTQYSSGNLNTSWVSKTGNTYYGLLSREDYDNSPPTETEYILIAMANHATPGYRPVLTATYSSGGTSTSNFFAMF